MHIWILIVAMCFCWSLFLLTVRLSCGLYECHAWLDHFWPVPVVVCQSILDRSDVSWYLCNWRVARVWGMVWPVGTSISWPCHVLDMKFLFWNGMPSSEWAVIIVCILTMKWRLQVRDYRNLQRRNLMTLSDTAKVGIVHDFLLAGCKSFRYWHLVFEYSRCCRRVMLWTLARYMDKLRWTADLQLCSLVRIPSKYACLTSLNVPCCSYWRSKVHWYVTSYSN